MADIVHHKIVAIAPALHVIAGIGREPVMKERLVRKVPAHPGIERDPPSLEEECHAEGLPHRRFQVELSRRRNSMDSHDGSNRNHTGTTGRLEGFVTRQRAIWKRTTKRNCEWRR